MYDAVWKESKSTDPVNLKVRFARLSYGFGMWRSDFLCVLCVWKQEFLVKQFLKAILTF